MVPGARTFWEKLEGGRETHFKHRASEVQSWLLFSTGPGKIGQETPVRGWPSPPVTGLCILQHSLMPILAGI